MGKTVRRFTIVSTSLPHYTAMDVSADLTELGRTPVAVVCAGVKSILDIGRTLEVLVCSVVYDCITCHHPHCKHLGD